MTSNNELIKLRRLATKLVRELPEDKLTWQAHQSYVADENGDEVCETLNEVYSHMFASYFAELSPFVVLDLLKRAGVEDTP
jgi:hypothetical protein